MWLRKAVFARKLADFIISIYISGMSRRGPGNDTIITNLNLQEEWADKTAPRLRRKPAWLLWINRIDMDETAVEFTERVYARELKRGILTAATLKALDKELYHDYYRRISRYPEENLGLQAISYPSIEAYPIKVAPELWSATSRRGNAKNKETPPAFIRRVYKEQLEDKTLQRCMLRYFDMPLYLAYATHIKRHPEDVIWPGDVSSRPQSPKGP